MGLSSLVDANFGLNCDTEFTPMTLKKPSMSARWARGLRGAAGVGRHKRAEEETMVQRPISTTGALICEHGGLLLPPSTKDSSSDERD